MTIMQSNKIISKGMKDPKCLTAMQLMQSNPKEAMTRFKDDEDVSLFLREFGTVMAAHFEGLAAAQAQQQQTQQQAGISEVNKIQEIGVLQAQAMQRQKEAAEAAKKNNTSTSSGGSGSGDASKSVVKSAAGKNTPPQETEEEKVQRVSVTKAVLFYPILIRLVSIRFLRMTNCDRC